MSRRSSAIDIRPYSESLHSLHQGGYKISQLHQWLQTQGIQCSIRTTQTKLHEIGIFGKREEIRKRGNDREQLRIKVFVLATEFFLNDAEIIRLLLADGIDVGERTLRRLRKEAGLLRRHHTPTQQADADQEVERLIGLELARGEIDGYGRTYLYTYFRQRGHFFSRDRLFSGLHQVHPEGIERRRKRLQHRRGELHTYGPDHTWSIDGHDKLSHYGIEIYACVDIYSRFIVWLYVGITNRTAVSCLAQFLDCLLTTGIQPLRVRSDRGGETTMLADAHYELRRSQEGESVQFTDCYEYGSSKLNVRVESWWRKLTEGYTFRYRVSQMQCFNAFFVY